MIRSAWICVTLLVAGALIAQMPPSFSPPDLHPEGVRLEPQELRDGVFALISSKAPVDNTGFIVGRDGVLVIDAHIDRSKAHEIQAAIRAVTDKPLRYLVNTNHHAAHTFGNDAFY